MASSKLKGLTIEIDGDVTGLNTALQTVNKQISSTSTELRAVEKLLKLDPTNVTALSQKQELLTKAVEATSEKLETLEKAAEGAQEQLEKGEISEEQFRALEREIISTEQQMQKFETQSEAVSQALSGVDEKADDAETAIDDMGEQAEDTADKTEMAFDGLASALVAAGLVAAISEIKDALLDCSDAAATFETPIAKVATIADTSQKSMSEIETEITDLSNAGGIATTNIAEATYSAISAGVGTAEAVDFVAKANELAVGGFTETETAVDVLTTALNAYGLSVEDVDRVSDVLINTQNKGKTMVDELASTMGNVIPLASAYGVEIENLGATYAVLTANGVSTAEATTYIKSMLNELGDSASTVAGILQDETGKSFSELSDEGYSVGDVLEIISDSVDGNTDAFNELWSSSEAGVGALSLVSAGAEDFNEVLKTMEESAGATTEAYETMSNTTEFAQERMSTAVENLQIAIGQKLNPTLADMSNAGADAVTWMTDFVNQNEWLVPALTATTIGLAALSVGVLAVTNATKLASVAQTAYNAVLAANPIGLATVALAALVAGITAYTSITKSSTTQTKTHNAIIKESATTVDNLTDSYNTNIEAIDNQTTQSDANAEVVKILSDEYVNLKDKIDSGTLSEEESEEATYQLKSITSQLTDALPDLINMVDSETGALMLQTTELQKLTQAYYDMARAKAIATAYEAKMTEAATTIVEAQTQIDALVAERDAISVDVVDITKATEALGEFGASMALQNSFDQQYQIDDYNAAIAEASQLLTQAESDLEGYTNGMLEYSGESAKAMEDYENAVSDATETVENQSKTGAEYWANIGKEVAKTTEETKSLAEAESAAVTTYANTASAGGSSGSAQVEAIEEVEDAMDEAYQNSVDWIEEQKNANNLALGEEMAAWERVMERYEEGTDERIEAEENYYRVKEEITTNLIELEEAYTKKQEEAYTQIQTLNDNYLDTLKSRTEEILGFYGLFDEVQDRETVSSTTLIKNLKEQVAEMQLWTDELQALQDRGISDDLYSEIASMGITALSQLQAMNAMTDEQLTEFEELIAEKTAAAAEQAAVELEPLKEETVSAIAGIMESLETEMDTSNQIAADMVTGLAEGIIEYTPIAVAAAEELATSVNAALAGETTSSSSSTTQTYDSAPSSDYASAVTSSTDLADYGASTVTVIQSTADDELYTKLAQVVGQSVLAGLVAIDDRIYTLLTDILTQQIAINMDGTTVATLIFADIEKIANSQGKMFPTEQYIINMIYKYAPAMVVSG